MLAWGVDPPKLKLHSPFSAYFTSLFVSYSTFIERSETILQSCNSSEVAVSSAAPTETLLSLGPLEAL